MLLKLWLENSVNACPYFEMQVNSIMAKNQLWGRLDVASLRSFCPSDVWMRLQTPKLLNQQHP